jgi:hypothetical protein
MPEGFSIHTRQDLAMNTAEMLAERVDVLRRTGRIDVTDFEELVAIQDVEPRAEVADASDWREGALTVVCRPMTIQEAAASRGLETYDTALPDAFVAEIAALAGDPRRQIVWCYDTDVFGGPAAITPEGDALLAVYLAEHRSRPPGEAACRPRE